MEYHTPVAVDTQAGKRAAVAEYKAVFGLGGIGDVAVGDGAAVAEVHVAEVGLAGARELHDGAAAVDIIIGSGHIEVAHVAIGDMELRSTVGVDLEGAQVAAGRGRGVAAVEGKALDGDVGSAPDMEHLRHCAGKAVDHEDGLVAAGALDDVDLLVDDQVDRELECALTQGDGAALGVEGVGEHLGELVGAHGIVPVGAGGVAAGLGEDVVVVDEHIRRCGALLEPYYIVAQRGLGRVQRHHSLAGRSDVAGSHDNLTGDTAQAGGRLDFYPVGIAGHGPLGVARDGHDKLASEEVGLNLRGKYIAHLIGERHPRSQLAVVVVAARSKAAGDRQEHYLDCIIEKFHMCGLDGYEDVRLSDVPGGAGKRRARRGSRSVCTTRGGSGAAARRPGLRRFHTRVWKASAHGAY